MAAEPRVITLPAHMDLDALDGVREQLVEAVEAGSIEVDGSGVERMCTNGLLLLISAAQTAQRQAVTFKLTAPSARLLAAVETLGLDDPFKEILAS